MSLVSDLLVAFEVHSPESIRSALTAGASPTDLIRSQGAGGAGKTPMDSLIEGYLRSQRFTACLRVLIDAGATIADPVLEAVLFDDDEALERALEPPDRVNKKLTVPCAFTSCEGVTPLHICAEFNSVRCARILLDAGADVNATADTDADGFGGQTPIFHAVNSIHNYCRPMMELLADAGADLDVRVTGLIWGPGQDWETRIVDVTPLSYAQCALYAQFHRREEDVYANLAYLYRRRYGPELPIHNVPNRYLL